MLFTSLSLLLQLLVLDNFKRMTELLLRKKQQTSDFSIQPQEREDAESEVERGETEGETEGVVIEAV